MTCARGTQLWNYSPVDAVRRLNQNNGGDKTLYSRSLDNFSLGWVGGYYLEAHRVAVGHSVTDHYYPLR